MHARHLNKNIKNITTISGKTHSSMLSLEVILLLKFFKNAIFQTVLKRPLNEVRIRLKIIVIWIMVPLIYWKTTQFKRIFNRLLSKITQVYKEILKEETNSWDAIINQQVLLFLATKTLKSEDNMTIYRWKISQKSYHQLESTKSFRQCGRQNMMQDEKNLRP